MSVFLDDDDQACRGSDIMKIRKTSLCRDVIFLGGGPKASWTAQRTNESPSIPFPVLHILQPWASVSGPLPLSLYSRPTRSL